MAKIPQNLPPMASEDVASDDLLIVEDVSQPKTKRITVFEFMKRIFAGDISVTGDIFSRGKKVLTHEDTGWINLELDDEYESFSSDGASPPAYRIKNGVLYFKGSITAKVGNLPSSGQNTLTKPNADIAQFYMSSYSGVMLAGPTGGSLGRIYIGSGGTLTFGASSSYGNGTLSYITITGLSGVFTL